MQIKLTIKGQKLTIAQETIAEQTIDYLEADASFSSEWDNLIKFAHFTKAGCGEEENYVIELVNDKITKDKHLNLSKGEWIVSLHGNEIVGEEVVERATTTIAQLYVKATGFLNGEPLPITPPSVGEQILAKVLEANTRSEEAKNISEDANAKSTEALEKTNIAIQRADEAIEQAENALEESEKALVEVRSYDAKINAAYEYSQEALTKSNEALEIVEETQNDLQSEIQRATIRENELDLTKAKKSETYTKTEVDAKIAQATPSDYEEVKKQVETNKDNIESIQLVIPNQASEDNQLTDKDFVNSSIATNTATFIGTFNSVAELEAYSGTKTNNDYAFVVINDETTGFVKEYNRYKWTGTQWLFEYSLNNSSFTAQQWATINSGLTSDDVDDLHESLEIIATLEISKQETLVSGENIKTINQHSILGGGDIEVMQYYEVTYEHPNIVKDGVIQTYEMLKEKFEDERYWLYLKVNGVCFLPLGTLDAEQRGVLQFNTQYEATNADDGIRYERIEINSENVVSTKFVHFEVTENKSKTINARNKSSETSYPSNKAITDYVDSHIPTKVSQLENDEGYLKEHQSLDNYYTKGEVDASQLEQNNKIDKRVEKVEGKGLSTNDFTNEYKTLVDIFNQIGLYVSNGYLCQKLKGE